MIKICCDKCGREIKVAKVKLVLDDKKMELCEICGERVKTWLADKTIPQTPKKSFLKGIVEHIQKMGNAVGSVD